MKLVAACQKMLAGSHHAMKVATNHTPDVATAVLHPVSGATFALLDDTPVVFSEADQEIFQLNQLAAFIWCRLENRIAIDTICSDLIKSGVDRASARNHIESALRNWLELGLIEPVWIPDEKHTITASVGRLSIRIRASSKQIVELLASIFVCTGDADSEQQTIEIVESDGLVTGFHGGTRILQCSIDELAPTIKAYLTDQAILKGSPDVALHAACLLFEGKGLLLSGPPGAGKTTLALHLLDAGLTYGADDVALIAPDGSMTGLLFAPTVKSGSWPIVEHFRTDLDTAAIHTRSDGKRVRYLKIGSDFHHGKFAANWIIFINRSPDQGQTLTRLGELETVTRLIHNSYSSNGKLTLQAFKAVRHILAAARSFELQYTDANQARRTIIDLCDGKI